MVKPTTRQVPVHLLMWSNFTECLRINAPSSPSRWTTVAAIRKSDRPVLIISQSKVSIAVLSTLVAQPELAARVRGWFSIQDAFGGSPIADSVEASDPHASFTYAILALMLGL